MCLKGLKEYRPLSFVPVAEEDLQAAAEFVPDGSERIEAGFLRSGDGRRVGESPVNTVRFPEEYGADLLGAERDHGVDGAGVDGFQPLGSVTGDVDADLLEGLDRMRADGGGGRSCGRDRYPLRGEGAGDPFGHLATSRVRDAKEQDVSRPLRAEFRGLGPPLRESSSHRFAARRLRAGRVIFRSQIAMGPIALAMDARSRSFATTGSSFSQPRRFRSIRVAYRESLPRSSE
jgi:hypothetical protein